MAWVEVLSETVASCQLLSAQCSVLSAQCSVLSAQCSVLSAQCSERLMVIASDGNNNYRILITDPDYLFFLAARFSASARISRPSVLLFIQYCCRIMIMLPVTQYTPKPEESDHEMKPSMTGIMK